MSRPAASSSAVRPSSPSASSASSAPSSAIGIDVGGTKCLGVLLAPDGSVLTERRRSTPVGADELVAVLASIVDELGGGGSVGIGLPGLVDRDGRVVAAPHLQLPPLLDVGGALAQVIGREVSTDNDNTTAGLAEWRLGAGRGVDDLLFVGFGTGIGGLAICGGSPAMGTHGFAGEFGHMVVDPLGPSCPCGRRGCWERLASGTGLALLARRAVGAGRLAGLVASSGAADAITGEQVRDAAVRGDTEALAVVDDLAGWIALGLVNLVDAYDPALVVLGGGLAANPGLYLGRIERAMRGQLLGHEHREPPRLTFAVLGERAAAIGAALLPAIRADLGRPAPPGRPAITAVAATATAATATIADG